MLAGLRHDARIRCYHQNGSIHLGGTGDHIFDIVGVARAIDVSVVTIGRLIFDVRCGNCDGLEIVTLRTTLRDVLVGFHIGDLIFETLAGNNGSRGCGLAVIDVPNCAHVHVRLVPVE